MRYSPRHAVIRAVKSLSPRQRIAAIGGSGIAVTAGLALAVSMASAAVTPIGTTTGTSGYEETDLGVNYWQTGGTFTVNPDANSLGVTTNLANPNGAIGGGLCNNGSGQAAEIGVVETAVNSFEVVAAVGKLVNGNPDPCTHSVLNTATAPLHPLLTGLPVKTSITYLVQEYRTGIKFSGEANSGQSFDQWFSFEKCTKHPGYWTGGRHHRKWHKAYDVCKDNRLFFNEALAGVMQSLQNLGGPATNDLTDFTGVRANGVAFGTSPNVALPIASSATGNPPWLVGPASAPGKGPNGPSETCVGPTVLTTPVPLNSLGDFGICAATATGA